MRVCFDDWIILYFAKEVKREMHQFPKFGRVHEMTRYFITLV